MEDGRAITGAILSGQNASGCGLDQDGPGWKTGHRIRRIGLSRLFLRFNSRK